MARGLAFIRDVLVVFLLVEAIFQLLALAGVLPGVDLGRHVPYARAYWTREGHSNTWMNRYGWHQPAFDRRAGARRIAIIGDSFVEAMQVAPEQNLSVRLQAYLEAGDPGAYDVIGLGISGIGPAQYQELVRYAHRQFAVDEMIVMLFVGNDFRNLLPFSDYPDSKKGWYKLDDAGALRFTGYGRERRDRFRDRLERNHRTLLANGVNIVLANLFLPALPASLVRLLQNRVGGAVVAGEAGVAGGGGRLAAELDGRKPTSFIYREPAPVNAEKALRLARAVFASMKTFCDTEGIVLRVVSIPHFPRPWYAAAERSGWSRKIDGLNLARPEQRMRGILAALDIPYIETGRVMERENMAVDAVRGLYLDNGGGHFSVLGHDFFARLILERFYPGSASVVSPFEE